MLKAIPRRRRLLKEAISCQGQLLPELHLQGLVTARAREQDDALMELWRLCSGISWLQTAVGQVFAKPSLTFLHTLQIIHEATYPRDLDAQG